MTKIVVVSNDSTLLVLVRHVFGARAVLQHRIAPALSGRLGSSVVVVFDVRVSRALELDLARVRRLHRSAAIVAVVERNADHQERIALSGGAVSCIRRPLSVRGVVEVLGPVVARHQEHTPLTVATLPAHADERAVGRSFSLPSQRAALPRHAVPSPECGGLVGVSEAVTTLWSEVARVARCDFPVLVIGETGSGKELVARALHRLSKRAEGPFIPLNAAAVPQSLIESELFGVARGAFTGALSRAGVLERAHWGTLFLDEVGDVPLESQVKLLRVLEHGQLVPVGGTQSVSFSVRFVAATNRPLQDMATKGRFRSDLLYRLSAIRLSVPPLRARREDIPYLVEHLLNEMKMGDRRVSAGALALLQSYDWPGNVRELRNVLQRAIVHAAIATLTERDIEFYR